MDAAIERARAILSWPDDWDGEGSPAYQEATLAHTAAFLAHGHGRGLPTPHVWAGPDGSIDVRWEFAGCYLLVNVEPDGAISFYGDGPGTETQGAYRHDEDPSPLFDWLERQTGGVLR